MSRTANSYEYIVVGSGSAGAILSYRLGQAGYSVGVIEAGGEGDITLIADPLAYGRFRQTSYDWNYKSLPQAETDGRTHTFPRGKLWGGSSSVNGMVYIRGARMDFEAWENVAGEQWGWDSALQSFEELEGWRGEVDGRLLEPQRTPTPTVWHEAFLGACADHGFVLRETFDDGLLKGAGWTRLTMRNNQRRGALEVFLLPALANCDVELRDECLALRVLFDRERACGVECWDGSQVIRLMAEREVIVCCGSFNSPQLLLLSGIGAPDELSRFGIAAVSPLREVGMNLSDHLVTGVVFMSDAEVPAGPTAVTAFEQSANHLYGSDLQLWFNRRRHSAASDVGTNSFTILCALVRPASRGTVRLAGGDAHLPPVIDVGYLADGADVRALAKGLRRARELGNAKSFRGVHPAEVQPGAELANDEELIAFVRRSVGSQHHPMGTCRMGQDNESVVDPRLRVRGVSGLRVADASIFPSPVATGPDASVQMVAWRAADLILEDADGRR